MLGRARRPLIGLDFERRVPRRSKTHPEPAVPIVGLLTIELHLPHSQSLKAKRTVIDSIKDRLRRRFNVAVAETGYQELWQRSVLSAVAVSAARPQLESALEAVSRDLERYHGSELVGTTVELIS